MPVINRIASYSEEMTGWRHWLHRHPELAFDLPKTSAYVAERLAEIGVDTIHEGIARTGIVALIEGRADGPTIALRADMDALPIHEAVDRPYGSETAGRMHACGHDGHTTLLLGAAKYLAETRNFAGRVALLFQPAEEDGGGAEVMVAEGVMERFEIEEVYGLHNDPTNEAGHFRLRSGPIMAACADFDIRIEGIGGHAAMPEEARDPVAAALQIGQALMSIVPRNLPAQEPVVLSLTGIEAGEVHNVIPALAHMRGTVRGYDESLIRHVGQRIDEICEGIGTAMAVTAHATFEITAPATVNSAKEATFAAEVARDVVGEAQVDDHAPPVMGTEDFAFMLKARPGAFVFLGQGEGPGCHHPAYDFNDAVLPIGASYFARLIERRLPLPG